MYIYGGVSINCGRTTCTQHVCLRVQESVKKLIVKKFQSLDSEFLNPFSQTLISFVDVLMCFWL